MATRKSKKAAKKAAAATSTNTQRQLNSTEPLTNGIITISSNNPTDSLITGVAALSLDQNAADLPVLEVLSVREQRKLNRKRDIVGEFARYFGEESKLANWQRLCCDVGIEDDLPSVTKCREALRKVWVNIFDLLDAVKAGTHPKHFKSQSALRHHTIKYRKIYPKKEVKKDKGNPAAALLAHIFV